MQKLIAGALTVALVLVADSPAQTLIPVTDRHDVIFDSTRNLLYITTRSGRVERFDPSTGMLLSPFTVGGSLGGGDTTPDGQFLYVADATVFNQQSFVQRVDLNTGAHVTLAYNTEPHESGAWDVVVMNNDLAFTTGEFAGSGRVHLRQLNLATDTFTIGLANVRQRTHLHRSADRSAFIGLESNASRGPIFDYQAASNSFPHRTSFNSGLSSAVGGASGNGDYFAVRNRILNSDLSLRMSLSYSVGGLTFDPFRDLLYIADYSTDELIGYDFENLVEMFRLPIGENISASESFPPTEMTISDNTRYIFLTTPSGVRFFNNPIAVPEPSAWVLAMLGLCGFACIRFRRGSEPASPSRQI